MMNLSKKSNFAQLCGDAPETVKLSQFHLARRKFLLLAAAISTAILSPSVAFAEPVKGGAANVAMVGEPQSLDPMATTTDIVGKIMQHVYEPLYTYDKNLNLFPMIAESLPDISSDGLTYTIKIRKGVKFHNGRELDAKDVHASLKRWMELAPQGKAIATNLDSFTIVDKSTVVLKLKTPFGPLLAQLALPTSMAGIMPKETIANPLKEYVGTGPYKFIEHKPDQHVLLKRFDDYSARSEEASGSAGKRVAYLDELRFIPVPNPNTRIEGALSGQFHYADLLPVESIKRIESASNTVTPILIESFGFPYFVFNTKEGVLSDLNLRNAVRTALGQEEMLIAAFGSDRFYKSESNFFPKGTPYYSNAGESQYNEKNPTKAKELAKKANYNGELIRIMASRQYEFHYNMALVLDDHLKKAGFNSEVQVVDWATLVQRRNDPKLWDIYFTHSPVLPEPMLSPPQLNDGAPGWWDTPAKKAVLAEFNQEGDINKRNQLWGKVQQLVYDEVPFLEVGKFNGLSARSNNLQGFVPTNYSFFWNTWLSK